VRAYLLSYDIADKKRLRKMHRLAKAHGKAVQFSVFACLLRPTQRVLLASRIEALIDAAEDRVILIDLGSIRDRETWIPPIEAFGKQMLPDEADAVIA
jgi:CRISPR-associated protein Cas2